MSRRKRRPPPPAPEELPEQKPAAMRSRPWYLLAGAVIAIAAAAGAWWALHSAAPPAAGPEGAAAPAGRSTPSPPPMVASFVGSEACAGCHEKAYAAWKDSHHARAMQHATPDTVLGNFAHAGFRYAGIESTFFQRDGKYFVHTDGADGKLRDFEIKFTFGVEPLQQYLIEFPDGRIQALSIAWDSRPAAQARPALVPSLPERQGRLARRAALDRLFAELEFHVRRLPFDRRAQELRRGRQQHVSHDL